MSKDEGEPLTLTEIRDLLYWEIQRGLLDRIEPYLEVCPNTKPEAVGLMNSVAFQKAAANLVARMLDKFLSDEALNGYLVEYNVLTGQQFESLRLSEEAAR